MRPLVAVRRAAPFDPRVLTETLARSPLFWPLARAASTLAGHDDFPPVEALGRVFASAPPVRFVTATRGRRKNRRGNEPRRVDASALYDARITLDCEVPTRPRCWHDLMNALVWGTFPLAKRALHARQHRAVWARVAPDDTRLPASRTRELDALAILDEGGIAVLAREPVSMRRALKGPSASPLRMGIASGAAVALIFGHAVYESIALGVTPAVVAALVLQRDERDEHGLIESADLALMRVIDDGERLRTPDELSRVNVNDLLTA
jgi:hypothetical protein